MQDVYMGHYARLLHENICKASAYRTLFKVFAWDPIQGFFAGSFATKDFKADGKT